MSKHSFIYTVVEEFVEVDKKILKQIKDIKLTKDNNIPEMNYTSYYNQSSSFNNFIENKLSDVFKKYNLILRESWVQKYSKNSYHVLHTHDILHKSFVWFIEGNKNSSPLYFYDVGYPMVNINESIKINFRPGTLVIFPGFIPHEVRPNKSNNRLIVSGNVI